MPGGQIVRLVEGETRNSMGVSVICGGISMKGKTVLAAIGLAVLGAYAGAEDRTVMKGNEKATLLVAQAEQTPPPAPTPQQHVAMLKQWLQASQSQLRRYEWIETTTLAMGGEEKSRQQKQVYYGVDGKLQKLQVAAAAVESGGPPGILPLGRIAKRVAKRKKKELTEYMHNAAGLVQSYIPPDPNRIQKSINAGKFSFNPVDPGRRVRLDFRDYLKSGDVLSIDLELPTNRLLGIHVSSYLETAEDAVQLDVAMGVLPDATIFAAKITLDAKAKDVIVTIENSGHRNTGR